MLLSLSLRSLIVFTGKYEDGISILESVSIFHGLKTSNEHISILYMGVKHKAFKKCLERCEKKLEKNKKERKTKSAKLVRKHVTFL